MKQEKETEFGRQCAREAALQWSNKRIRAKVVMTILPSLISEEEERRSQELSISTIKKTHSRERDQPGN
jgi:hypothetical protein